MRRWLGLIAASLLLATADAGVTHAAIAPAVAPAVDDGVPPSRLREPPEAGALAPRSSTPASAKPPR